MHKLRRRGLTAALVGATAAGIMAASAGTASAAAWTDTPYFYDTYARCADDGKYEVSTGQALNWACAYVKWFDGSYVWQLRLFVE